MNDSKRVFSVVLIDDEIWALRGLKGIADWKAYGFDVIGEFTDSAKALAFICEKKPDLIFTDIRMPDLDGMSLIEAIKKAGVDSFVVIVTAYRDFEIARQALKNEVSDYIIKPLDKEEVRSSLSKLYISLCDKHDKDFDIKKCDLSSQKNRELPAVRNFLNGIFNGSYIRLLLCDEPLAASVNLSEVYVKGYRYSYLAMDFEHFDVLAPGSYGCSRAYKYIDDLEIMFDEAFMSYDGDFLFSKNQQTADIEKYLCQNMTKKLSMDDIATHFYLSKPYIFELFREYTDTSAMSFLKNLRLSKAAKLLKSKTMSVREISLTVGFEDAGHFGKLFKAKYNCTPEQYAAVK